MDDNLIQAVIAECGLVKQGGEVWTDSRIVAARFGKRHDDVLRAIRGLGCSEEFRLRNFAESDYVNEQGRQQPMYRMTRDGFALLAMGFTGREAMAWKERFIDAFNALEHHALEVTPDVQRTLVETQATLARVMVSMQKSQINTETRVEQLGGEMKDVKYQVADLRAEVGDISYHLRSWVPRRELRDADKKTHRSVIAKRYRGLCPCCNESHIISAAGEAIVGMLQYDHWFGRHRAGLTETWPVCRQCNSGILERDRTSKNNAFLRYQELLREEIDPQRGLDFGAA